MKFVKEYMKFVSEPIKKIIDDHKKSGIFIQKSELPERMNSYEWDLCLPLLSTKDLIENAEYYILNSFSEFERYNEYLKTETYNETLKHKLIHYLIDRLKLLNENEKNDQNNNALD